MKTYEITIITKEEAAEKDVKDMLSKMEAKVLGVTALGEKQLSYKIKKESRGFLTVVLFELDPAKLTELNKKFTLSDEILRFIIIAKKPSEMIEPVKKAKKPEVTDEKSEVTEEAISTEVLPAPEVIEEKETEIVPVEKKSEPVKAKKEVIKPKIEVKKIEKIEKEEVKPIEKPAKKAAPKVVKEEKVVEKDAEVTEIEKDSESEEDRLKELDKKLDELLKD